MSDTAEILEQAARWRLRRGCGGQRGARSDPRRQAAALGFRRQQRPGLGGRARLRRQNSDFCRARRMKGRTLDHVVAAARDHRSVALATDLGTGRQLLLDGYRVEGDLAIDDQALDRVREAWRAGRSRTIETAAGPLFVEVLTPP